MFQKKLVQDLTEVRPTEKPEIVVADILRATELGLIHLDEFRNIMKSVGWELMEQEQTPHRSSLSIV